MLTDEEIQEYKERLERELKEVGGWFESHPLGLSPEELEHYEEFHERIESIEKRQEDWGQKKERKEKIIAALEIIKWGKYGNCQDCGKEIKEKLEIDPAHSRCCECQVRHLEEKLERYNRKNTGIIKK